MVNMTDETRATLTFIRDFCYGVTIGVILRKLFIFFF